MLAAAFYTVKIGNIKCRKRIDGSQAIRHISNAGGRTERCFNGLIAVAMAHACANHETIFYVEYRNDMHE
jgi:hypothetical protein